MRRFGRLFRRLLAQPLALSQALGSASGALALILAAIWMGPADFVRFSLVNLVAITVLGAARAFVFQPAIIARRTNPDAVTPVGYALAAAAVGGVIGAIAGIPFVGLDPLSLALVFIGTGIPVLHEWARFRFMIADLRWWVAAIDGARLATVLLSPLLLIAHPTAAELQGYLGGALLLPVLASAVRLPRIAAHSPFASYRRAAGLQLADYAIGQFLTIIPLLVLGSLGQTLLLGGVRFAQTLLGPLNLAFSAASTTLLADAATRGTHAHDADLIAAGRRLGRRILILAAIVVPGLILIFWLGRLEVSAVPNRELLIGLGLAGCLMLSTGWSGIQAVLMRLLGFQAVVTAARAVLIALVVAAYVGGYLAGGVDAALIAGFITAGIANPLVFAIPSRRAYRRALGAAQPAEPADELDGEDRGIERE